MTNNIEGKAVLRTPVDINVGSFVSKGTKTYKITELLDFNSVIGIELNTGRSKVLKLTDLSPILNTGADHITIDIDDISDDDWKTAQYRYAIIKPLLTEQGSLLPAIKEQSTKYDVSVPVIYRWLSAYKGLGVVSALIPKRRGWQRGKSRLPSLVDAVINEVIEDTYLTLQRPTVKQVITEVRRRCMGRNLSPPHDNTIRAKVSNINLKTKLRRRGQKEQAKNKFNPTPGHFPHADYPLAVVQIDHTPLDIILVDDTYRQPIGRPWLTLAIDVYSRMVTGYYLSFDPPSGTSVAMCMAHSILPKDAWLNLLGVDATWDVWGIMDKVHVDNGADFRSGNFLRSCEMYGINLEFRPVKQPQYGGHIERLLGTLLKEIHNLPGTTFSSVKEREDYQSEKHSCLTKNELDVWLATLICKVYHQRLHTGINTSPSKQWEIGIFGNGTTQARGLPKRPQESHTLLLDFLPSYKRTVQTYGVTIDGLNYYADVIRSWINASETDNPNKKREFTFRRDPRDISVVWFFDPDIKLYFRIPFANQSLPTMSIWEYKSARKKLKQELGEINEHSILRAVTELREQVQQSAAKTKKARRKQQRRIEHEKQVPKPLPQSEQAQTEDWKDDDISYFEDIA